MLCRPQPEKTIPWTLVVLNILETNTVNCLRTTLCRGPKQTVSCDKVDLLLIEQVICPKSCWQSEAVTQLSSAKMRFSKTSHISQKTSDLKSLFRKIVSSQGWNCTKKGHHHWYFPVNMFMWIYFFIFTFLFQKRQKQPPKMFCERRSSQKFRKFHKKTPVLEPLFNIIARF